MVDNKEGNASWLQFFLVKDKSEIPELLYMIAVSAVVTGPRLPLDTPCSIGGHLSNSFRKILLVANATFLLRTYVLSHIDGTRSLIIFLWGMEGVLLAFLSLLTPYLLRVWLQDRINVPGGRQPGKGLMPWIQACATLTLVGVIGRSYGRKDFWFFKKVADSLSFFPVMQTLRLYNAFVCPPSQVRYPGRGSVLSQVVMIAEYYALFANARDALSKLLVLGGWLDWSFTQTPTMQGLYEDNFFSNFNRVMCHGILLNYLDEAYTIGTVSTSSSGDGNATASTSSTNRRSSSTTRTSNELYNVTTVQEEDEIMEINALVTSHSTY